MVLVRDMAEQVGGAWWAHTGNKGYIVMRHANRVELHVHLGDRYPEYQTLRNFTGLAQSGVHVHGGGGHLEADVDEMVEVGSQLLHFAVVFTGSRPRLARDFA